MLSLFKILTQSVKCHLQMNAFVFVLITRAFSVVPSLQKIWLFFLLYYTIFLVFKIESRVNMHITTRINDKINLV